MIFIQVICIWCSILLKLKGTELCKVTCILNFGFALIGTSERVCLITGNVGAIMAVLIFIMEKIREKPDMNAKQAIDFDNKTSAERDKQVRFIMFMYILYVDVNFNVFLWAGNFMVLLNLTKNQVHYRSVFIIHVQNV